MPSIIVPKRSLILPVGSRGGLILPQSQRGFMVVNPARFGSSAPPQYWNPADFASELTLSAANAVATRSTVNNGSWRSGRSVTSHSTGKRYAECQNNANGSTNGAMIFGVCKAAASLSSYPGSDANSWGNQANNPTTFVYLAGTPVNDGGIANISGGGYAKTFIDFDAGKGWFGNSNATNGGWYNGDPSLGTSPTFTFPPGTQLWLMIGEQQSPQQTTLRTGTSEMLGTIPTGGSGWG